MAEPPLRSPNAAAMAAEDSTAEEVGFTVGADFLAEASMAGEDLEVEDFTGEARSAVEAAFTAGADSAVERDSAAAAGFVVARFAVERDFVAEQDFAEERSGWGGWGGAGRLGGGGGWGGGGGVGGWGGGGVGMGPRMGLALLGLGIRIWISLRLLVRPLVATVR